MKMPHDKADAGSATLHAIFLATRLAACRRALCGMRFLIIVSSARADIFTGIFQKMLDGDFLRRFTFHAAHGAWNTLICFEEALFYFY